MHRVLKPVLISLALFSVGSVLDNLLTYYYVVVMGTYTELNPLASDFILTQPLPMWFIRDYIGFTLIFLLSLMVRKLLRVGTWWVVVFVPSLIRLLPAVHAVLMLFLEYDSPLDDLAVALYRALGLIK